MSDEKLVLLKRALELVSEIAQQDDLHLSMAAFGDGYVTVTGYDDKADNGILFDWTRLDKDAQWTKRV